MKNRTKGVIAGIAGLALLSGGTTFALWQDNTNVTGGTITNGDLAVAATPITWVDNSADRPTHPTVDLTTWKMVPGDTLVGTTTITTTVKGDNLVAQLGVETTAATQNTGVTVTYAVTQGATTLGSGTLGGAVAPFAVVDGGQYTVTLTAEFPTGDLGSSAGQNAATVLGNIDVTLDQVRS